MILNENAYSNHWKMNTMINSDFSKQPEEKKNWPQQFHYPMHWGEPVFYVDEVD